MKLLSVLPGIALAIIFLPQASAQKVLQQPVSMSTYLIDDGKGVVRATVKLHYLVRKMDKSSVAFSLSFSEISIDAEAGYYYQGRKYGSEVPGLIETLRGIRGDFPKIRFDVYYGAYKQGSFTYQISAHNDLGAYTGDFYTFRTTADKVDHPNWRLEPRGMETFNYVPDPTIWMKLNDLVIKYERERKSRSEYDELIRQADRQYASNQHGDALASYIKASRHPLADAYPKTQAEKIRAQLDRNKKESGYNKLMDHGKEAENSGDYNRALGYYRNAAALGIDDSRAGSAVKRVENLISERRRKEEDELKEKIREEKRLRDEIEKQKLKEKEEAVSILRQKEEELEEQNRQELKKLKEQVDRENREKLEREMKDKLKKEAEARKKQQEEEARKEKQERSDRRKQDEKTISRFERNMSYDPVHYAELLEKAEQHFANGNGIRPYEALQLEQKWWDRNPYMESFREDLNEPRRQEAWEKSQRLLRQMESEFEIAKYYYMEAIRYTDRNSRHHKFLLGRVEFMNRMIDMQKAMIKASREDEETRRNNYETAKVYKYINRIQDNRMKAQTTYHILTQDYLYPNLNSKVTGSENAIQRQYDFERRLNEADQQLQRDQLITGVTSELAMGAMLDDSKRAHVYGNHSMGFNLFAFTGYANYPVVANEVPTPGYIPQTFTRGMTVAPFHGGFDWWINRSRNWDLGLSGDLIFGVLPFKGYANVFFSYGGTFRLNAGFRAVKLALEADWHQRSGSYEYDQDVAMSDMNNPWYQPTDMILQGKFNYTLLRTGAGLHFSLADRSDDGHIRLMIYAEKPSFYKGFNFLKPVYTGAGQIMFRGGITISGEFSSNYPVAGKAENILESFKSRDYFRFTFGKTWTIGKTK